MDRLFVYTRPVVETNPVNLDLSSKQACDLYDCSRATLANWVKNGLPKSENGYPLKGGVHWHIKRQTAAGSDKDSKYWQKEFRKFKAQLAEIDLKIKRGDLVAHADVLSALKEMQNYVKKHLRLIPRIAPERMIGQDVRTQAETLGQMVDTILTTMATGNNVKQLERILKNGKR